MQVRNTNALVTATTNRKLFYHDLSKNRLACPGNAWIEKRLLLSLYACLEFWRV